MKAIRITHKHSAGCLYREAPNVCWYISPRENSLFWGSTSHRWIFAVCNDPDCKGRVRVSVDALEDFIYSQTGGPE